jgi:hypothetical protein
VNQVDKLEWTWIKVVFAWSSEEDQVKAGRTPGVTVRIQVRGLR